MNAKEKMSRKNKQGAVFTDDGFAMGMNELTVAMCKGGADTRGRES